MSKTDLSLIPLEDLFSEIGRRIQHKPFYLLSYYTASDKEAIAKHYTLMLAEENLKAAFKLLKESNE